MTERWDVVLGGPPWLSSCSATVTKWQVCLLSFHTGGNVRQKRGSSWVPLLLLSQNTTNWLVCQGWKFIWLKVLGTGVQEACEGSTWWRLLLSHYLKRGGYISMPKGAGCMLLNKSPVSYLFEGINLWRQTLVTKLILCQLGILTHFEKNIQTTAWKNPHFQQWKEKIKLHEDVKKTPSYIILARMNSCAVAMVFKAKLGSGCSADCAQTTTSSMTTKDTVRRKAQGGVYSVCQHWEEK